MLIGASANLFICPSSDCAPPPKEECTCAPPPPKDECAPPPPKDECAPPPPKDECAAPIVDKCAGANGPTVSVSAPSTNSSCGGQSDNSCEVAPLSMTREVRQIWCYLCPEKSKYNIQIFMSNIGIFC